VHHCVRIRIVRNVSRTHRIRREIAVRATLNTPGNVNVYSHQETMLVHYTVRLPVANGPRSPRTSHAPWRTCAALRTLARSRPATP
jgi:hypothetical protein